MQDNSRFNESKGFWSKDNKKWYLVYCLKCDRENYASAVSSSKCAWCEYDPTNDGEVCQKENY